MFALLPGHLSVPWSASAAVLRLTSAVRLPVKPCVLMRGGVGMSAEVAADQGWPL